MLKLVLRVIFMISLPISTVFYMKNIFGQKFLKTDTVKIRVWPPPPTHLFADVIVEWSLTLFESTELTLVRRGLAGILEKAELLVPCSE